MNGILLIDKPEDFTSFDVVAKVRGMAGTRKVGHGGTLDPMATGVLPLFLGAATRFCDLLPDADKRYTATFRLGQTTDTQDRTGTLLEERPVSAGPDEVRRALADFVGEQEQIPPMYSAVRVKGERLYDLARKGVEVERKPRRIRIDAIELLEIDAAAHTYTVDVLCSKGTYIRTLCHDLGQRLGCGAVLTALRRTVSCGFAIERCVTLDRAQALTDAGELEGALIGVDEALAAYPPLYLDEKLTRLFVNGVRLSLRQLPAPPRMGTPCRVYGAGREFLGLAAADTAAETLRHLRLLSRE